MKSVIKLKLVLISFDHCRNLSDRLIKIFESSDEELTKGTVVKLRKFACAASYNWHSHQELYSRIYRVYHDLGRWLRENLYEIVESLCREPSEQRRSEHIPLAEVPWALVLTKDGLVNYLDICGPVASLFELYLQQESERVIGHFFDRAMCYVAEGFRRLPAARGKASPVTITH